MSFTSEQMELIKEFEEFVGKNWYKKINIDTLDLHSYHTSVFGHIYGSVGPKNYWKFRETFDESHLAILKKGHIFASNYFLPSWIELINQRKSEDKMKPGTQAAVWYNGEKINVTYLQDGLCITNDWKLIPVTKISTKKHAVLSTLFKDTVFWNKHNNKMIKCNKVTGSDNQVYAVTPDNTVHILSETEIVRIEE